MSASASSSASNSVAFLAALKPLTTLLKYAWPREDCHIRAHWYDDYWVISVFREDAENAEDNPRSMPELPLFKVSGRMGEGLLEQLAQMVRTRAKEQIDDKREELRLEFKQLAETLTKVQDFDIKVAKYQAYVDSLKRLGPEYADLWQVPDLPGIAVEMEKPHES